jgi:uncharacterized Zn finger protein (UPF0148 family)
MKLLAINCNHCGAPLEVSPKARYVTCSYCDSRLEVHRSGSAAYTEVLDSIDDRTEKIAKDVEYLKLQSDLEQLDRQWTTDRQQYMIRGKEGQLHVPGSTGGVVATVLVVLFGLVWTMIAGAMFPPMALFGLIFIGFAVFTAVSGMKKAEGYRRRQQHYERQRREVLDAMREQARS